MDMAPAPCTNQNEKSVKSTIQKQKEKNIVVHIKKKKKVDYRCN